MKKYHTFPYSRVCLLYEKWVIYCILLFQFYYVHCRTLNQETEFIPDIMDVHT